MTLVLHQHKIWLFTSGFCSGILLFYFHLKHRTRSRSTESTKSKDSEENLINTENNVDEESTPILRYIQTLTSCCIKKDDFQEKGNVLEVKTSEKLATGEVIRQLIDEERGTPLSFDDYNLFQNVISDEDILKLQSTNNNTALPALPSNPIRNTALKGHLQSEPVLTTKLGLHCSQTNVSGKKKVNASSPTLTGKDFQRFADEHLRMPSTVFITPYPLHMVYRKMKSLHRSSHLDFGYCQTVTISDTASSFHKVINQFRNNRYGSEMDWPSIYDSDLLPEPYVPAEFQKIFSNLLLNFISYECWVENYYHDPIPFEIVDCCIENLPEYQLFIKPLFYGLNTEISNILEEYYKIVQKQNF